MREHCTGFPADHAYGIVPPKAVPVLSSRKKFEGFAVRWSSYVNVLMLLLLACLPKRLFFFVRNNTNFDLTQLSRIVAWPRPSR